MRKSKRGLLSLLLTLAMVLTMLPTTALAVDVAPVDTAPTDAAAPAEPETAPAPEETPEEPAPDASADADADEPAEAPEKPAETPEAPAEDTDAPAGDEAPAPEETTPPADADTGADAEAPEAPEEPAGQPEETPAPEEEPAGQPEETPAPEEEPKEPAPEEEAVPPVAANKVLDSGPVWEEGFVNPEDLADLPDNDELFAGYVEKSFYEDGYIEGKPEAYGETAGKRLTAAGKRCYDLLKAKIEKIARGEIADTNIEVLFPNDTSVNWGTEFSRIFDALLVDCPYDYYWFDKTMGYTYRTGITPTGERGLLFAYPVAKEYQGANLNTTDLSKTKATSIAVTNAKAIVDKFASLGDYDKLKAYNDEICKLVDYNHDAAENENTPYGDPWQLIWIFDNNPATKVVCEGYAKGFQYLCDMSRFTSDKIVCYTVTGVMAGGTGAGNHMWNVVKMDDGLNYLVDVTNCDPTDEWPNRFSVGAPDLLFLAGGPSKNNKKFHSISFVMANGSPYTMTYDYAADNADLYVDGYLELAPTNYTPVNATPVTITGATLAEKVFDGFDDGTVAEVTFKKENDEVVDLKGKYTATVKYDNANAGTNKTATVTVSITDRNYKLANNTYTITTAEIKKATAQVKIQLTSNQQKVGKAVGVVVGVLNPNSNYVVSQPKTVVMDTPAGIILNKIEDIIFTGTYNIPLDATIGDMNFTAKITDPNFVEASATAVLKVVDKGPVNVTLTADKTENVTYGDSVTFTAKAAKANADDTDTLAGKLTLSLGGKVLGETEDPTKDITVTLDKADLKAGTHTLKADFVSSNNFFGNSSNTLEVTVAQKTLAWNTSAITVAVRSDAEADVFANPPVQGKLAIDGVLEGDKVEFTYTDLTAPAMTKTPAEQKLNLTVTGAAISGDSVANYKLPDTAPEVIATVNEINEIKNPEEGEKRIEPEKELPEGAELKLVVETGISTPIAGKTPADIIGDLKTKIQETIKDLTDKFAVYDVALLYKAPGSDKWVPADEEEHFPVTIVLPYPAATNYTYAVSHMKKDGTVEALSAENVKDGLRIKVTSLSPIGIAWTEPTYSGGGGGGGNYSGDIWEKIEKMIEEADKGDRIEAKVYDENMPVSTMQALYDDGGVTLVIKWNDGEIIIPAGKALNPSTEAGRIYYPLSYLAELYKGSKIPSNAGNPETGGVWVITAPAVNAPAPTEPVPVPEAVEPTPEPEAPKAPETPTATAPVQPEEPVNSSSKVGTIVALLALMAAAAAGAYFLYKKRDDDGLYTK